MLGNAPEKPKNPPPSQPNGLSLSKLINSAGRVNVTVLQRMAQSVAREDFVRFLQTPVLAGSAIHQGNVGARREMTAREMNRTVLF